MNYLEEALNGRIIAFEGLDNSFKETNYHAFVARLRYSADVEILTESFPRYGTQSAIMLEKWLDDLSERKEVKA